MVAILYPIVSLETGWGCRDDMRVDAKSVRNPTSSTYAVFLSSTLDILDLILP